MILFRHLTPISLLVVTWGWRVSLYICHKTQTKWSFQWHFLGGAEQLHPLYVGTGQFVKTKILKSARNIAIPQFKRAPTCKLQAIAHKRRHTSEAGNQKESQCQRCTFSHLLDGTNSEAHKYKMRTDARSYLRPGKRFLLCVLYWISCSTQGSSHYVYFQHFGEIQLVFAQWFSIRIKLAKKNMIVQDVYHNIPKLLFPFTSKQHP